MAARKARARDVMIAARVASEQPFTREICPKEGWRPVLLGGVDGWFKPQSAKFRRLYDDSESFRGR